MKKLFLIILTLILLCACSANEPAEVPAEDPVLEETPAEEQTDEPVVWKINGTEYEVNVPVKTRFENYEDGDIAIYTPSISETPATVDLSGLSGCEDITRLSIYISAETEKIVVPDLPNVEHCYIFDAYGSTVKEINFSSAEKIKTINLDILTENLIIGKGTESLILGRGFDLSKISGGENLKSITLFGGADLSLLPEIGKIEKVYITGEGSDIGELKDLKSLKRLSLIGTDFDLSKLETLSVETLVLGDYIGQSTADSITRSETVTELHLSDRCITDISVIEKMPNLKTIILTVDGIQEETVVLWHQGAITEEMVALLKTNVDKKPLEKFIKNGGEIYLFADPNRATVSYG